MRRARYHVLDSVTVQIARGRDACPQLGGSERSRHHPNQSTGSSRDGEDGAGVGTECASVSRGAGDHVLGSVLVQVSARGDRDTGRVAPSQAAELPQPLARISREGEDSVADLRRDEVRNRVAVDIAGSPHGKPEFRAGLVAVDSE